MGGDARPQPVSDPRTAEPVSRGGVGGKEGLRPLPG